MSDREKFDDIADLCAQLVIDDRPLGPDTIKADLALRGLGIICRWIAEQERAKEDDKLLHLVDAWNAKSTEALK